MSDEDFYCEYNLSVREDRLETLIAASVLALGYIVDLRGVKSPVVLPLAKAIKNAGVKSSYLDAILEGKEIPP